MDEFALRLHSHLATEGNLVWSPYSVATVLALVAAGARGTTRDELVRALGAEPERLGLAEAAALQDAEVAVAAALWARQGLPFEDAYRSTVAGFPGGALHNADFARDPESVRRAINADVRKTTRELIEELLPPGTVDADTAAVIVSALYLKAAWLKPFDRGGTRPGVFHGAGGRREVPMMRQTERLPYAESGGWRMVTLDAGGPVAVDVLLGDGGVPDQRRLDDLRRSARATKVALSLPRFRVESRANLTGPLLALGIAAALGDDADFSAMTSGPVRLDRIEHKAVLDVDEDGFEGAAATAAVMVLMGMDTSRPLEFRVDRPFLVLVRHPGTGAIFFVARVTDPG
jgi:serine protease inhibitor